MTKQEAKRYIHETYSNTELYPEAVKRFREFQGEWDELVRNIKELEEE
jgi:uncharacterized protein Yka (UPF0111/DUF47 family)